MSTWAPTAGRTVQRGCEPKAIGPLQREREADSSRPDIGTSRRYFNDHLPGAPGGYSLRRYGAGLAPSARQVPANPRTSVRTIASPAVATRGPGRNTHSACIAPVTRP